MTQKPDVSKLLASAASKTSLRDTSKSGIFSIKPTPEQSCLALISLFYSSPIELGPESASIRVEMEQPLAAEELEKELKPIIHLLQQHEFSISFQQGDDGITALSVDFPRTEDAQAFKELLPQMVQSLYYYPLSNLPDTHQSDGAEEKIKNQLLHELTSIILTDISQEIENNHHILPDAGTISLTADVPLEKLDMDFLTELERTINDRLKGNMLNASFRFTDVGKDENGLYKAAYEFVFTPLLKERETASTIISKVAKREAMTHFPSVEIN